MFETQYPDDLLQITRTGHGICVLEFLLDPKRARKSGGWTLFAGFMSERKDCWTWGSCSRDLAANRGQEKIRMNSTLRVFCTPWYIVIIVDISNLCLNTSF